VYLALFISSSYLFLDTTPYDLGGEIWQPIDLQRCL
jgi:hypothetical protein